MTGLIPQLEIVQIQCWFPVNIHSMIFLRPFFIVEPRDPCSLGGGALQSIVRGALRGPIWGKRCPFCIPFLEKMLFIKGNPFGQSFPVYTIMGRAATLPPHPSPARLKDLFSKGSKCSQHVHSWSVFNFLNV